MRANVGSMGIYDSAGEIAKVEEALGVNLKPEQKNLIELIYSMSEEEKQRLSPAHQVISLPKKNGRVPPFALMMPSAQPVDPPRVLVAHAEDLYRAQMAVLEQEYATQAASEEGDLYQYIHKCDFEDNKSLFWEEAV